MSKTKRNQAITVISSWDDAPYKEYSIVNQYTISKCFLLVAHNKTVSQSMSLSPMSDSVHYSNHFTIGRLPIEVATSFVKLFKLLS